MAGLMWMGLSVPSGHFAAPNGTAGGAGTFASPWDLQTAMNGGNPGGSVTAGDTVWLRGGIYTPAMTTANMAGTPITKVVIDGSTRIRSSTNPWVSGDVGKAITVVGAGAGGADLVTTIATYQAPNQVLLTAGAQVRTQFDCCLEGTSASPITFRAYPGEHVIIDGNYDSDDPGNSQPAVYLRYNNLTDKGRYLILRDVDITNSNPHRLIPIKYYSLVAERGDCVILGAPGSKLINCILRNGGEGTFQSISGGPLEVYGNLVYHNGEYAPMSEQNEAAAIDLVPSGGTAVALSGTYTDNQTGGSPSVTITNHNNTGDYTVVAALLSTTSYTTLTATYDGAAMTRIVGKDGDGRSVALFGIAGHGGTHNAVVTTSGSGTVRAIAQSFSNVGSAAAGGTWSFTLTDPPPGSANTASDTNHMVVDGIGICNVYSALKDFAPSGDNTGNMIGGAVSGNNPRVKMSWATRSGAGNVAMGWNWTMDNHSHGHGMYVQNGGNISDGIAVSGNAILTAPPATDPWRGYDVGSNIIVYGAGVAGADLVTTIAGYTNYYTITLTQAPSTSVNPAEVTWGHDRTIKDNVVLDQCNYSIQLYGSSNACGSFIDVTGNVHAINTVDLGGTSGYRMTNSHFRNNYTMDGGLTIGLYMQHMTNFDVADNYIDHATVIQVPSTTWEDMTMAGNTFIGTIGGFTSLDFPGNTYSASDPVTNSIIVRPNAYESNRANIYVYNWQNLTTVSVDLSSAVAAGTPIYVMNAQDYFNTPVWSGTYAGGSITLPQSGTLSDLTVEVPIGGPGGDVGAIYPTTALMAPAFVVFIVRAKSQEPWRG